MNLLIKIIIFIVAFNQITSLVEFDAKSKENFLFTSFQRFMKQYSKSYGDIEEFVKRFKIFKSNIKYINDLNLKLPLSGKSSVEYGLTKFSDLTKEEFKDKYLGLKVEQQPNKFYNPELRVDPIPASFDWREKGAVAKVKNQYNCGSCWAFSVVGNIEGLNFLKTGKMTELSEQQLVSCDPYDKGCRGGYMENAYKYLIKTKGIETEAYYYYVGFDDECLFDRDYVVARISDYAFDKTKDYNQIKRMLMKNAPLSLGFNAVYLQNYKSGIIDMIPGEECTDVLNHGVVLVGFGAEDEKEYWIIKNSWGADWGEKGYFRIRNEKGICGVNGYISTALMK